MKQDVVKLAVDIKNKLEFWYKYRHWYQQSNERKLLTRMLNRLSKILSEDIISKEKNNQALVINSLSMLEIIKKNLQTHLETIIISNHLSVEEKIKAFNTIENKLWLSSSVNQWDIKDTMIQYYKDHKIDFSLNKNISNFIDKCSKISQDRIIDRQLNELLYREDKPYTQTL